jgi:hypothetical protein
MRWIPVSLLGTPKFAGTDCLDVRKGEVLVVDQVVEDLVVRSVKGTVVGGFEGNQNDWPKDIVYGERAHAIKSSADIANFTEVGVDSFLGVDIPGHKTSDLTGKKDSLHTLVLWFFFGVVNDQVLGLEELTAERAACQNPTGLDTKGLKESVGVVWDVFVASNCAACEAGLCWKISRTTDSRRFTAFRT